MENTKETLSAFLDAELSKQNLALDQATLDLLYANVDFIPRPSDESEEERSITTKQDSTGKLTAESIKLWNLSKISTYDLFQFVWKQAGLLIFDDPVKKILYGLGTLLVEYYPKVKHEFNEQDAKVLFSIAKLKRKEFTTGALLAQYNEDFETEINEDSLEDSLDELIEWNVIERTDAKHYEIKERITNLSRKA